MEKNNIQEEVTITPVIRDIEKLFIKLFQLIGMFFKGIGKIFLGSLKLVVTKLSLFSTLFIAGILLAVASYFVIPPSFESSIILSLNVDAKAQLANDITYVQALIKKKRYDLLSEVFEISEEEAESLEKIEIQPYVSFLEQLEIFNSIYERLDSNVRRNLDFNTIVNSDNSNFLTDKYIITVFSRDEVLFSKIEKPLLSFLERVPELQEMRTERKLDLNYEIESLERELADLDTLKNVLNQSLIAQAKSSGSSKPSTTIQLGKSDNDADFSPLDVHYEYMEVSKNLNKTKGTLRKLDSCYVIYSHFSSLGKMDFFTLSVRLLIGAVVGFLFGFIVIFMRYSMKQIED